MAKETAFRLYLSLVLLLAAMLFSGPFVVMVAETNMRDKLFLSCLQESSIASIEFCSSSAKAGAILQLWQYLIHFLPAAVLLWVNWAFHLTLRFSHEAWPRRSIMAFLLLGILCGIASSALPIWQAITFPVSDINERTMLMIPYFLTGPLFAPLFFHKLLSPYPPNRIVRVAKLLAIVALLSPAVAIGVHIARS